MKHSFDVIFLSKIYHFSFIFRINDKFSLLESPYVLLLLSIIYYYCWSSLASDAEEKVVGRVQADAAIVKLESIDSKVRATSPQIFLARNLSKL